MRKIALAVLLWSIAWLAACGGAAGGSSGGTPIVGKQRGELCDEVSRPAAFQCPAGARKRGKGPPEGTEMWCEDKDGRRQGPYRRFPPNAEVTEPTFVGDNVVVGAYKDDRQEGAWWTRRPGVPTVSVQYFEGGAVAQKIDCHL
jgi:hypothetical protein